MARTPTPRSIVSDAPTGRDYLSWYKHFLGITPRYQTRAERGSNRPAIISALHLDTPAGRG